MAVATGLLLAGAGMAAAPLVASAFKSPAERQALRLVEQQQGRLGDVRQELNAMGQPVMDAEVNRLNQILAGNLGISDTERAVQERNVNRALATGTSGASSLGARLRSLGANVQSSIDATTNLAARNAMMERQNELMINQQLAQAESRQEAFNEIRPFQELQAEAQGIEGAINQNQYLAALMRTNRQQQLLEGIGSLGSTAMSMAVNPSMQDTFTGWDTKMAENRQNRRDRRNS